MERYMGNWWGGVWGRGYRSPIGGRFLGLRHYVARKTHSTGIKLYVLADKGGGDTSSTPTSTPGVAAKSAALGHVAASMTPRVSCAYGRRLCLCPGSFVGTASLQVVGLPRKARNNACRSSWSKSKTSEMPALQGSPSLPGRVTWRG